MVDQVDLRELREGSRDLVRGDFRQADLSKSDLTNRDFSNAHLEGANLQESNLTGSTIKNAHTSGMNASRAIFQNVQADGTVIFAVDFQDADLRDANLQNSHITRSNFSGANLVGADFRQAVINDGCIFDGCVVDESTYFDDASILRSLARQDAFRFYKVERGKLVRITYQIPDEIQLTDADRTQPQPPLRQDIIRQVDEIEAHLRRLQPEINTTDHGGIGHNQPPEQFPLNTDERNELVSSLALIRLEATTPSEERIGATAAIAVIQRAASNISSWAAAKADLGAQEFAKQMGKSLADGRLWIAGWLLLSGKLETLISTLTHWHF